MKNRAVWGSVLPLLCVVISSCSAHDGSAPTGESTGTVVQKHMDSATGNRPHSDSDLLGLVSSSDRMQVQGFDATGHAVRGATLSVADVEDSRLVRFADGYAVPDTDSIAVVDANAKKVNTVNVPEVDADAALTASDSSPEYQTTVMAFDLPPEVGGTTERTRIARVHAVDGQVTGTLESQVITRKGDVTALTACEDGSAAWLEFNPMTIYDIDGAGLASLVTWTEADGVESYPIDYDFVGRPWDINQLDCDLTHNRLVVDDGMGGVINLGIQRDDAAYEVVGKRTVKDGASSEIDGNNGAINGDLLTTINDKGKVTVIDMYKGAVTDDAQFSSGYMNNRTLTGTSSDADYMYALLDSKKSGISNVVVIDADNPACRKNVELSVGKGASILSAFVQKTDGDTSAQPRC